MYLYRAVDSKGNTINFFLNKTRGQKAVKIFFKKALRSFYVSKPIEQLKKEKNILDGIQLRQQR